MASIKDVAKHANVGIATVSRVINNSGFVSKETRQLVLESIEILGYRPNEVARNFKKQQTNIIGLIIPNVTQDYTAELTYQLEHDLFNLGYHTLLCISNHDGSKELEYIEKLRSHQVSGIIITAPFISKDESLLYNELPIVSVDRYVNDTMPYIHVDNYHATKSLTEKLIKACMGKVAYIGFGADANSVATHRKVAFETTCKEMNRDYQLVEMFYEEPTKAYIERVIQETSTCTGYFFGCDTFAHLFIAHLHAMGRHPLNDYQIVAFDGLKQNENYPYDLTCVKQSIDLISQAVVQTLMKRINHSHFENDIIVPYIIHQGNTCK